MLCKAFLWSYYGYPNSNYEGVNVEVMRYKNGEIMARDEAARGTLPEVDYVAGIPDSGVPHAMGYAQESGYTYARPFVKYTPTWPRSFTPASQNAVLNANYMMNKLKDLYTMAYDEVCMHEFVMSLADLKKKTGISAMDIAKGLLDNGIHPPTMYFPLIVEEALMVEPTETESKETLDEAVEVLRKLYEIAETDAEQLHQAPVTTPVTRMDEVGAARHPYLRYEWQD